MIHQGSLFSAYSDYPKGPGVASGGSGLFVVSEILHFEEPQNRQTLF